MSFPFFLAVKIKIKIILEMFLIHVNEKIQEFQFKWFYNTALLFNFQFNIHVYMHKNNEISLN